MGQSSAFIVFDFRTKSPLHGGERESSISKLASFEFQFRSTELSASAEVRKRTIFLVFFLVSSGNFPLKVLLFHIAMSIDAQVANQRHHSPHASDRRRWMRLGPIGEFECQT